MFDRIRRFFSNLWNKDFDLSDAKICYFFDSGFYGNHVKNAFNAISLPTGSVVVYKYRIDPKRPQASPAIVSSFRQNKDHRDNKHNLCLLIIVDRYHEKADRGTLEEEEKKIEFAYYPFRYGEILNIVDEGDDYVYVYVKLLHFVRLKDCNKATTWLSHLIDEGVYPPIYEDEKDRSREKRGHSEKYAYDFTKNTLTYLDLFELPKTIHDDARIWNKIIEGVEKLGMPGVPDRPKTDGLADIHFFEKHPSSPSEERTSPSSAKSEDKRSLFFYRFHISKAFGSSKEIKPKIDSFTIGDDLSTSDDKFRKGFDYHYNFKLNQKYAIVFQCCFPYVKESYKEKEKFRILIKLGDVPISNQMYSDYISTQRIVFSINRRQFLEHSIGKLTIQAIPSNDLEKTEFYVPRTVINYQVRKGFRDSVLKSIPVAIVIAFLLTMIDTVKLIVREKESLFVYFCNNWRMLLLELLVSLVITIPLVVFTKRDLL